MKVAIIQARMGASRLPGKVLMKIGPKPMLRWVVEQTKKARLVDEVIVATSTKKKDDAIEKLCKKIGAGYSRGSQDNVLDRYFRAGKKAGADIVVRITADCPFLDPSLIDQAIEIHLKNKNDYTANDAGKSYPRGIDVEVFNFSSLEKARLNAAKPYQREHVTPFLYEHPEIFKIEILKAEGVLKRPELRFCVDTKEDLKLVRKIYALLQKYRKSINIHSLIDLFDSHPELAGINARVKQKELGE